MSTRDDKQESLDDLMGGKPGDFVKDWHVALKDAETEEQAWRETEATDAWKAYKGDEDSDSADFNIFHSNIETLVPALYNSDPIPDVRRRFNDDDPVAATLSDILERAISFSVDDYDFSDTMKRVVKDMAVVDRGIARIRYEPTKDAEGNVTYEEAKCEYHPWEWFRRGPAVQWDRLPWIAFGHFLSRNEVKKLLARSQHDEATRERIFADLKFSRSAEVKGKEKQDKTPKFGGRELVWEIWDKDTKTVVFVSEDYGDFPICIQQDPLKLRNFFPTPRPAAVIELTDSLTPMTSYKVYRKLIAQLNAITQRIDHLVSQIRVRGAYAGIGDEITEIVNAGDGELVPLKSAELFATTGGGIEKAITWFPLEPVFNALKVLVEQREIVKQTIYEVTGIADIIRGATDPGETATAQNIKQQWGSIRIKSHQQEVERYARDLFELKAEIFCKHFDLATLLKMTGIKLPTAQEKQQLQAIKQQVEQAQAQAQALEQQIQAAQETGEDTSQAEMELQQLQQMGQQAMEQVGGPEAVAQGEQMLLKPTQEEIQALMQDESLRRYTVDVESDSTIRGDLTKNQEQMKGFLEGVAAYVSSIGPMVQEGVMDGRVAIEIFSAFMRTFRLGKQAESALDEWADKAKKEGMGEKAPDPKTQAEANKIIAETKKIETETELLPQQAEMERMDREDQREERKARFKLDAIGVRHGMTKDKMAYRQQGQQMKQEADFRGRELDQSKEQFQADLGERKATRQQGERMERMKLQDGRSARMEGYHMTAQQALAAGPQPAPGGAPAGDNEAAEGEQPMMPPPQFQLPQQQPLEGEVMTDEELQRMDRADQILAQVAQGLERMAQAQQTQAQTLTQAIQIMVEAITAPKELIRGPDGRAVGVKLMEMPQAAE